jgi:hypothetical protein
MLEQLNQSMVKAFLVKKGYCADSTNPNKFIDKTGALLNQATFETLKKDPTDGLAVFAAKEQGIYFTPEVVTFEGDQSAPTPLNFTP